VLLNSQQREFLEFVLSKKMETEVDGFTFQRVVMEYLTQMLLLD
jgi:hypothetical protein